MFPTRIHDGEWMVVWLSRPSKLPEASCWDRRRVLCTSRGSRLARLALERTSSRANRARESPDWTHHRSVGLSARWGKCPCQCHCDVCSNLSCYTCRRHQNSSWSCRTNRRICLRTILHWTVPASACRRYCLRNNMTRWPSMGERLFGHGHSHIHVRRNIRPEPIGIYVGTSAHYDLPWRVHRCFRQPAQCMPSLCPSRSTSIAVALRSCLLNRL